MDANALDTNAPNAPLEIKTERLLIRRFEMPDWPDMLEWTSDPEVARYEYWEPYTEERVKEWIQSECDVELGVEGRWVELAIELRAERKVIGDVAIKVVSKKHQEGEIGWTLNRQYQGQGYATEAAQRILALGFGALDLHRITAVCDVRNVASHRLMERLGMRREAHFRHNRFVKGEWCDEYVYAILFDEWLAEHGEGPDDP